MSSHYDANTTYVAISDSDRHPRLHYAATIHHGIDTDAFDVHPGEHLIFFGRTHPDKGTAHAIAVARSADRPLIIAGIIQDEQYFADEVAPHIDGESVRFLGPVDASERTVWGPNTPSYLDISVLAISGAGIRSPRHPALPHPRPAKHLVTAHGRVSGPHRPSSLIKRIRRVAFGIANRKNYRSRSLLHAGKRKLVTPGDSTLESEAPVKWSLPSHH